MMRDLSSSCLDTGSKMRQKERLVLFFKGGRGLTHVHTHTDMYMERQMLESYEGLTMVEGYGKSLQLLRIVSVGYILSLYVCVCVCACVRECVVKISSVSSLRRNARRCVGLYVGAFLYLIIHV